MPMRLDKEKVKNNLKFILDKMHGDTDLVQLSEYRKLFKKEISLFRRSWTAAWLLMYYDQRETSRPRMPEKPFSANGSKSRVSQDKPAAQGKFAASVAAASVVTPGAASSETEILLSEDESKRLFISIGKNRRLFPREVITLIMSKTSTAREDIGSIRILDNYSFVQVRDTRADEIISALNGIRFRGRTLAVNFAKPKNSESEADAESR